MLKKTIEKLSRRENLDSDMNEIMTALLDHATNDIQKAAFLVLLRAKRETPEELFSILQFLKKHAVPIETTHDVLDIVGTGGDKANTINISTGSCLIAAATGVKIAKHGSHAVSSQTGSADLLEALGVNIHLTPKKISESIDKIGIGFCYAPNFHPLLRELKNVRKMLNVPTTLNLIAPLLNPANPKHFMLGVYDESLLPLLANTLRENKTTHSLVFHGSRLDELSTHGSCQVIEIKNNTYQEWILEPSHFGFKNADMKDLKGGNAKYNAEKILSVLKGEKNALADTLILNAGVATWLYGLHSSVADGIGDAKESLYSGKALTLLKHWIDFSYDA